MNMTPEFVARALSLPRSLPATEPTEPFTLVTTDSRKVERGCLFVALAGEKFDGHDFIGDAIIKGARGILCRSDFALPAVPQTTAVFRVADTLAAYRALGAAWRRQFELPLVAIAGSVGKTTTKEILAAILRGRFGNDVLKTLGSQNGFVGIPMTLLDLRSHHRAAVIEVGIDDVGAMESHMELVEATSAILTAIGPEHLENLVDVPTVAREEAIALEEVSSRGGLVVVNLDDPWIHPLNDTLKTPKKIGYSLKLSPRADLLSGRLSEDERVLEVRGLETFQHSYELPLPGAHNAGNLLGAIAVALGLGLSGEEIERGLKSFQGADGRSQIKTLSGGVTAVCDYYNASPVSTEAGLKLLSATARKRGGGTGARWACLADMLELGDDELKFHRELAGPIMELGVENVLLFGPRMRELASELKLRGHNGRVGHFSTHAELAHELMSGVQAGDTVLIKGSRSMRMEEVWKILSQRH